MPGAFGSSRGRQRELRNPRRSLRRGGLQDHHGALSHRNSLIADTPDGWLLGERFVVDALGTPAVCLSDPERLFDVHGLSSFHVQFERSGSWTQQCTHTQGSGSKPN